MLSLHDAASIEAALRQPLDLALCNLIVDRLALAESAGLQNHTRIVVVPPGDDEHRIEAAMGFSPLVDPMNGSRFGTGDFQSYWAWLADVGGWYELIHAVGNSGFAYIQLIAKADWVLPDWVMMRVASVKGDPLCA